MRTDRRERREERREQKEEGGEENGLFILRKKRPADAPRCNQGKRREVGGEKREEIKQRKRQEKQKKINNGSAFVGRWAL